MSADAAVLARAKARRRRRKPWSPLTRTWFAIAIVAYANAIFALSTAPTLAHAVDVAAQFFAGVVSVAIGSFAWRVFRLMRERDER